MKNERVEFLDNPCIQRIEEKCIHCGVCKKTCDSIQGIGPNCIKCGQCILSCPTGALVPKYDYQTILNYLNDTDYTLVISMAPAARVSLTKELNIKNDNPTKKVVGILKRLGFDYVYDVAVGADLTTIEEATEFVERLERNNLPLMTSCCPSWKKYAIENGLDKYVSSTKSPIKMQGYLIKNYLSKFINFDKKLINVMLMPCVSKKEEIIDSDDIDYVITTRELLYMINESKIDLETVCECEFDDLVGKATSSGIIYGTSGGVLSSVVRSAYYLKNHKEMILNYDRNNLNNEQISVENDYDFGDRVIKTLRVSTMNELKKVDIHNYDLIEVMACPGGCINGGGQPLSAGGSNMDDRLRRANDLIDVANSSKVFDSFRSEEIDNVYKYDIGIPGGKNAQKKLHDN